MAGDDDRRVEHRFAVEDDELNYAILISDGDQPAVSVLNGRYRRISGH